MQKKGTRNETIFKQYISLNAGKGLNPCHVSNGGSVGPG